MNFPHRGCRAFCWCSSLCLLRAPEPALKLVQSCTLLAVESLELEHTKSRQQISPACLFPPHFKAWSCDPKLSTSTRRCLGWVITALSPLLQPGKSSWIFTMSHRNPSEAWHGHEDGSRRAGRDARKTSQPQSHGIVGWKRSLSPTLDPVLL